MATDREKIMLRPDAGGAVRGQFTNALPTDDYISSGFFKVH